MGCSSFDKKDQLKFERLLCEYIENPINIDVQHPRFSWVVSTLGRGKYQTSYHILVASNPDLLERGKADFWDTKVVFSDATMHIPYSGKELSGNSTYYWKVIIWDEQGDKFDSPTSQFSTTCFSRDDWQALWIGDNEKAEPTLEKGFILDQKEESYLDDAIYHNGRSVLLRNEFEIKKPIKSARLYITGLGFYEGELNGKKVGKVVLGPAKTPYHKYILYDTYDVVDYLQVGRNALGIHLGNGWYDPYKKWWKEYRMQWFGYKKAIAQLHITYLDGSEDLICTNEKWTTTRGPVLYNCIYDGEVYDANQEIQGWSTPGFDDFGWEKASIMKTPAAKLVAHMMPPIEINQTKKPVKVYSPHENMKVFDLGQNFTGWIRLKLSGKKGTRITIRFSEELYPDGMLNFTCNENAKATIEYILKGDTMEIYEPRFTYFGFQYVEITSEEKLPEIHDLEGCVLYSANEKIGDFSCSHELINKMHHATVWSQMSNMLGYPMDCPQRDERLGWMGDAQVTAEEAMYNFNMALFYKNWFKGIRENQDPETGDIPIISPRPYIKDEGVEWSSSFINMVWNHFLYYGDRQILEENYEAMKKYMQFLESISEDYIVPKGWIGDWGSLVKGWEEGEPESVPTAFYYYNAKIMTKISSILGISKDKEEYTELSTAIRDAFNAKYFIPETKNYNDGSQMANAFPLYLGLVPEHVKSEVLNNLIHDIEIEHDTHLTTGVLGTKYLIDVLSLLNRSDISWALATQTTYPSWAEMMDRFNTMCEFWTLKQSHNHVMMGSIDAWFYKTLAGIQLVESQPAFKEFVIKPYLADSLDYVNASTNTLRGNIISSWRKTENGLELNVEVPFNCKATVYLPIHEKKPIFESGLELDTLNGIKMISEVEGYKIIEVGSGNFHFGY